MGQLTFSPTYLREQMSLNFAPVYMPDNAQQLNRHVLRFIIQELPHAYNNQNSSWSLSFIGGLKLITTDFSNSKQ